MTTTVKTTVKGGSIKREARTGRFVSVVSSKGKKNASAATTKVVKGVSMRHRDALKRLADR